MTEKLVVLDGSTFFVSTRSGDVEPGGDASGYFFADMRHLSTWQLLAEGEPLRVLSSGTVDYYSASIHATLARARVGKNPTVTVRRDRFVSDGVHEDLIVTNNSSEPTHLELELRFGSDFADLFEVKNPRPKRGTTSVEVGPDRVTLSYERDGFSRGTIVTFGAACELSGEGARFDIKLGARDSWRCCIQISTVVNGKVFSPEHSCAAFDRPRPKMPLSFDEWLDDAPRLRTGHDVLTHTYRQSLIDLAALRFRPSESVSWSLPAAGLPWFMALFGRDSIITSYQALPFQPRLALTTLEALAELQATEFDDFRDAEPGKILHELRCGELARMGEVPHTPYYGTHDATPLFLILLDEYERWTGHLDVVRRLERAARAALRWMEQYGDPDGDGYLEFRTRSPEGLINQGWKDSWNSSLYADGRIAEPPIALCEVQGYAYDARLRMARLARQAWGDPGLADRLETGAAELRRRFNVDFWSPRRGHFVHALDGEKRQVDALTSNSGHLLWSGIVDEEHAAATVDRLMAADMFSGWGIRTMSADDGGYNPIEYHNGTVWPHDTGIIAEGFRRYGFREQASMLARAIIEAAEFFDYRLPELFAGFARESRSSPVQYATASRPQAWSAGAPLLAMRTLLGFDPEETALRVSPHLPSSLADLCVLGLQFRGGRKDAP